MRGKNTAMKNLVLIFLLMNLWQGLMPANCGEAVYGHYKTEMGWLIETVIRDGSYNVIVRIDGNTVRDGRYNVIARIDGNNVRDERYNVIARKDGDTVRDGRGNVIARIDGTLTVMQWKAIIVLFVCR